MKPNFELLTEDHEVFRTMVQELVDHELAMYMGREQKNKKTGTETVPDVREQAERKSHSSPISRLPVVISRMLMVKMKPW